MFVTHTQNKDAIAFKSLVEETLAQKVVERLEELKIEVASQFFNTVAEAGGVSGGVAKVSKMPPPGGKGRASAEEPELPAGKDIEKAKTFKE